MRRSKQTISPSWQFCINLFFLVKISFLHVCVCVWRCLPSCCVIREIYKAGDQRLVGWCICVRRLVEPICLWTVPLPKRCPRCWAGETLNEDSITKHDPARHLKTTNMYYSVIIRSFRQVIDIDRLHFSSHFAPYGPDAARWLIWSLVEMYCGAAYMVNLGVNTDGSHVPLGRRPWQSGTKMLNQFPPICLY